MRSFNHFDFIAPYYDRFIKPGDLAQMTRLVGLPAPGRLLDAGGGTGGKSYPLSGMVDEVVVADSSMGMLAQAHTKGLRMTVCSQTEHLPFDREAFERILMIDALHHVVDYRLTLDELWRMLKPSGRLVIVEPDIGTMTGKFMALVEKLLLMRSHFIPPQVIADHFKFINGRVVIEKDNSTAWIVVEKTIE